MRATINNWVRLTGLGFATLLALGLAGGACVGSEPSPDTIDGGAADVTTSTDSGGTQNETETKSEAGAQGEAGTQSEGGAPDAAGTNDASDGGDAEGDATTVVQVSSCLSGACVLFSDGTVSCWGDQTTGATGAAPSAQPTATPLKIANLTNVVETLCINGTVCARKSDGSVLCWGSDAQGELGRGTVSVDPACNGTCDPTPATPLLPAGVKIAQLGGAGGRICARTVAGDVYCWGANLDEVFAVFDGGSTTTPTPTKIPFSASDVVNISIGSQSIGIGCAIRSDTSVWCWGLNDFGELGHTPGTAGDDPTCGGMGVVCNHTPTAVQSASGNFVGAKSVAVGFHFACALKTDGSVWCWGLNVDGTLGNGSIDSAAAVHAVPAVVLGLNTTALLSVSNGQVFAVDTTGNVKGWGRNNEGNLGLGSYAGTPCADLVCEPSPTLIPTLHGAIQIEVKSQSGIALKSDGTVWTWGWNGEDELGHGAGTNGDGMCAPVDAGAAMTPCNPSPTVFAAFP